MCRRIVAVLCMVTAALSARAVAQAGDLDSLRRRVERLKRASEAAWETAAQARQGYGLRTPLDTVRADGLRLVVAPPGRGLAERVAAGAWPELSRRFGLAARAAERQVFHLQIEATPADAGAVGANVVTLFVRRSAAEASVQRSVLRSAAAFVFSTLDSDFRHWQRSELPLGDDVGRASQRTYLQLALSPLSTARDCYAGVVAACRVALGLESGDSLTTWFSSADRRLLVRNLAADGHVVAEPGAIARCSGGSDVTCLQLLGGIRRQGLIGPPLDVEARALLTLVALELGGDGAFDRLVESRGRPPAERLGEAAGRSGDSVIAAWRERVLAARPTRATDDLGRVLGAGSAWLLLLAVLAMRSVRWRQV